jgi:hypothetical protein
VLPAATRHHVDRDNKDEQRTDDSQRRYDHARFYHGTRADLKPGDLIAAGYSCNYGTRKQASWVNLTGSLDAAIWGAEPAAGGGRERIYVVEPTGPIVDDPNLTDKKFPGQSNAVLPLPRAASGDGRSHGMARPLPRTAEGNEGPSRTLEGARDPGGRLIVR